MKTIFCILVLVAVVTLPANAQRNRQATPPAAPETPAFVPTHEGPHIQFEKNIHDFGQIVQGDNGDAEFRFRNMGSEPLILTNVQTGCGCAAPSWPREPIMPGQESSIVVRYNTGIIGRIGRAITVHSNSVGNNTERVILRLAGNVNARAN